MTDADIDRIDRRLADRARPWALAASKLIAAKVADARAHAEKSLTSKAREADDGRPTARVLDKSPSYAAALSRLSEALDALCGPSKHSLDGLARDARASFYEDSIPVWMSVFTEDERQYLAAKDPAPTTAGEDMARGLPLHGYELRDELAPAFDQAARSLRAVLNVSSRRGAEADRGVRMLAAWERTAVRNLSRRVVATIADSSVGIHHAVGLLLIHEDVRPLPSL